MKISNDEQEHRIEGLRQAAGNLLSQFESDFIPSAEWDKKLGDFEKSFLRDFVESSGDDEDEVSESELIAILKNAGPLNPYEIIHRLIPTLRANVAKCGAKIDRPVIFLTLPTGELNARVIPKPEGAIVVMNIGLMMALFQLSKVYSSAYNFAELKNGKITSKVQKQWEFKSIFSALSEISIAYWRDGTTTSAPQYPPVTGKRLMFLGEIIDSVEMFALAHEVAHITQGHLECSQKQSWESDVGKISIVSHSLENEYEADLVGLQYHLASSRFVEDSDIDVASYRVLGPIFLFSAMEMLREIGKTYFKMKVGANSYHPNPRDRSNKLLNFIEKKYGHEVLGKARFCQAWFDSVTPWVKGFVELSLDRSK